MLGRLFDDFEESIETLLCDLVCFVEDENFVAVASGRKTRSLSKFTRVIDPIVACRIDLDDVKRARTVS
jgi:hypothetical protein